MNFYPPSVPINPAWRPLTVTIMGRYREDLKRFLLSGDCIL
ncbi:hypothetical protein N24_2874 [Corynebacterium suranareeae]|uniref:Uncharacterized protein n=1 Tax=Corynebacterium suranareeae TaxID=2506452 RepID=A0A169S4N9_9CORY|nr:hypothetical protein N24_2874 [Corynebacterium suranareeae]